MKNITHLIWIVLLVSSTPALLHAAGTPKPNQEAIPSNYPEDLFAARICLTERFPTAHPGGEAAQYVFDLYDWGELFTVQVGAELLYRPKSWLDIGLHAAYATNVNVGHEWPDLTSWEIGVFVVLPFRWLHVTEKGGTASGMTELGPRLDFGVMLPELEFEHASERGSALYGELSLEFELTIGWFGIGIHGGYRYATWKKGLGMGGDLPLGGPFFRTSYSLSF